MVLENNCPWGVESVNLHGIRLSTKEKEWIVHEVLVGGTRPSVIAKRYSINRYTVYKIVRLGKNHKPLRFLTGRPRIVDKIGIVEIIDELHSLNGAEIEEKYELLLTAHQETLKRRDETLLEEELPLVLARRTKCRYLDKLELTVGNNEAESEYIEHFE